MRFSLMDDFRAFIGARRKALNLHTWVALALVAISLAFFAGVDYGNTFGSDDWWHSYAACKLRSTEVDDRPMAVLAIYILCPFLGSAPLHYFFALLAFRIINAFLVYLLVWQISPGQPLFAFSCAAAAATLMIHDSFAIFTLLQQNDHIMSVFLTLLALNTFTAYLRSQARWRYRLILLGAGLVLAAITPLVREATYPLLFAVPLILTVADRSLSKPRLLGLALWNGVIAVDALRFVLLLLSPRDSYSRGTFRDLNIYSLLGSTQNQMDIAFRSVFQLSASDLYNYRLAILVAVAVVCLGFLLIRRQTASLEAPGSLARSSLRNFSWIIVGLVTTWLGFAAFLPTIFANSPTRVQVLSVAGEAITLLGGIWLVSGIARTARWRTLIQLGGLAWVTAHGAMFANLTQQELYGFDATWDNGAYFMRSLANLVPATKGPVLFVYMENPATGETPYVSGWGLQYGLRIFYKDMATGLMPADNITGEWRVSDAGIWMHEYWIEPPHTFGWDQIIFFTRDISGRLHILDKLPERFLTVYRQSLYRPYNYIVPGFIPLKLEQTFPVLSAPDWKSDDSLSH